MDWLTGDMLAAAARNSSDWLRSFCCLDRSFTGRCPVTGTESPDGVVAASKAAVGQANHPRANAFGILEKALSLAERCYRTFSKGGG